MEPLTLKQSLWASLLAALGASVCCVGPLLLLMLGVSGAWIGHLSRTEVLRPYLMGATVLLLVWAWHLLYRRPMVCDSDSLCANPATRARQRGVFWLVSLLLLALLAFPSVAPLFLE